MALAHFRFHAGLNFFLPRDKKRVSIPHTFGDRSSIKDMIESLGVPHPEIGCIEVNEKYVDFSYIVRNKDVINVYPIYMTDEISPDVSVSPPPLDVISFILDIHLGKLANSLRLLGFDTLYRNDYHDEELARVSGSENRILLTRDKGLLMRSIVSHGYYVRDTNPNRQVLEVMRRFNLSDLVTPFHRCLRCNGLLESVSKESVYDELPESVKQLNHDFHRCQSCTQVYWKGSHYDKLNEFVAKVKAQV
jgi:uncharacterized protein